MLEKNSGLTRLCDRLEAKGYISRSNITSNRRQILISITENGIDLLNNLEPLLVKHLDTLSGLSEDEAH
jgi:DNA-binding MarR family transcriptional regulator